MLNYYGGEFQIKPNLLLPTKRKNNFIKSFPRNWGHSGRHMLFEILKYYKSKNIKKIYVPNFLCKEILHPIKTLGLKYKFYNVSLNEILDINFENKSIILVIHYFGKDIKNLIYLKKNKPNQSIIIEDISHNYLNQSCLSSKKNANYFFSMRKHFGNCLGAFSNFYKYKYKSKNKLDLKVKSLYEKTINASLLKFDYLSNSEKSKNIEEFYLKSFKDFEEKICPKYSKYNRPIEIDNIMRNLDYSSIIKKRQINWKILNKILHNKFENIFKSYSSNEVPLGYVIKTNKRDLIREKLKKKGIFTSIHWELPKEVKRHLFPKAYTLSKRILTIPIDQRYDEERIENLGKIILKTI